MDSFVPFGGFFPTIYESKGLPSCHYPSGLRCQHCNDKCEQEVSAILKGHSSSAEDQHSVDVPSWMQRANVFSMNDGLDASKVCLLLKFFMSFPLVWRVEDIIYL